VRVCLSGPVVKAGNLKTTSGDFLKQSYSGLSLSRTLLHHYSQSTNTSSLFDHMFALVVQLCQLHQKAKKSVTYIKRQALQHDCLPSLLGDGDK
jgi:hypothetical protein